MYESSSACDCFVVEVRGRRRGRAGWECCKGNDRLLMMKKVREIWTALLVVGNSRCCCSAAGKANERASDRVKEEEWTAVVGYGGWGKHAVRVVGL